MRIVGGKYRGRVLCSFKGEEIRPTADKVRESLFNILNIEIVGSRFLDLFCGTGAVGIEALSRGAGFVALNDLSRESLSVAQKNLDLIGKPINVKIYNLNALTLLEKAAEPFDIIFIDPPYKGGFNESAVEKCQSVLAPFGTVVLESEFTEKDEIGVFRKFKEKKYGRTYLTFYKREGEL